MEFAIAIAILKFKRKKINQLYGKHESNILYNNPTFDPQFELAIAIPNSRKNGQAEKRKSEKGKISIGFTCMYNKYCNADS